MPLGKRNFGKLKFWIINLFVTIDIIAIGYKVKVRCMELKICIHRGTHQIGGIATEIHTENTRILIDMGDELSLDPDYIPLRSIFPV